MAKCAMWWNGVFAITIKRLWKMAKRAENN